MCGATRKAFIALMFKLLGNRILLKPEPDPVGQNSGNRSRIWIPEIMRKEKPAFGTVVMLGTGKKIDPEIRVGQRVRVDTKLGSVDVMHEGEPHRIVANADVQIILGS